MTIGQQDIFVGFMFSFFIDTNNMREQSLGERGDRVRISNMICYSRSVH